MVVADELQPAVLLTCRSLTETSLDPECKTIFPPLLMNRLHSCYSNTQ